MRDHFHNKHIDAINADLSDNYFKPVLLEALEHSGKPRSVCDVGCGNGIFTDWIKDHAGCRLVGVDGSEYALKKTKQLNFDELHHIEDFSNDNLPFKDEIFDFVINKDVLEHLLNPENLVHEIARITRIGGFALIHVPNHFPISGRLKLLFKNTIDPFLYFPDSRRWDFPHIRFFNQQDFLGLMLSSGLKPVVNLCHHFPSFPKIGRLMPTTVKKRISKQFPDSFAEGFTYLFKK